MKMGSHDIIFTRSEVRWRVLLAQICLTIEPKSSAGQPAPPGTILTVTLRSQRTSTGSALGLAFELTDSQHRELRAFVDRIS